MQYEKLCLVSKKKRKSNDLYKMYETIQNLRYIQCSFEHVTSQYFHRIQFYNRSFHVNEHTKCGSRLKAIKKLKLIRLWDLLSTSMT